MIKCGSKINAKNDREETPLHVATENGHLQIVKYVLQHEEGVLSIAEVDGFFDNPLHVAATNGYYEIVKVMLPYAQNDLEKRFDIIIPYEINEYLQINVKKWKIFYCT